MKAKFFILILLIHCAAYPPVVEKKDDSLNHLEMQNTIKNWIQKDCGSCHTTGNPKANVKALQVFDLKFTDWMSRMNKKQLEFIFIERLGYTVEKENRHFVSEALGIELYRRKRSKPN